MSGRLVLACVASGALCMTSSCRTFTTNFHSGGVAEDESHERRTVVDVYGGSANFDLGKQCPGKGWAQLTFESRIGEGQVEVWRCRR